MSKTICIDELHIKWIDEGWCESITLADFIQAYEEDGYKITEA